MWLADCIRNRSHRRKAPEVDRSFDSMNCETLKSVKTYQSPNRATAPGKILWALAVGTNIDFI
eukprot:3713758-Amphidinium_carterae.1